MKVSSMHGPPTKENQRLASNTPSLSEQKRTCSVRLSPGAITPLPNEPAREKWSDEQSTPVRCIGRVALRLRIVTRRTLQESGPGVICPKSTLGANSGRG